MTPNRIPVYIDPTEPEIQDPSKDLSAKAWHPANQVTFKLLQCVEAIRDLTRILKSIVVLDNPFADRRGTKLLATPLYNLATGIKDMFNELEGNVKDYSQLTADQSRTLSEMAEGFAKEVPIGKEAELRIVRDKIGAHIDRDAVVDPKAYWDKVDLVTFLKWIRICSQQILSLLELGVYAWERESGDPKVWRLMAVDTELVDWLMDDDKMSAILGTTIVKSPKSGIAEEIRYLANLHNTIIQKC